MSTENAKNEENKDAFEDISNIIYPERSGAKVSSNLAESFVMLRCKEKVRKSFQNSMNYLHFLFVFIYFVIVF